MLAFIQKWHAERKSIAQTVASLIDEFGVDAAQEARARSWAIPADDPGQHRIRKVVAGIDPKQGICRQTDAATRFLESTAKRGAVVDTGTSTRRQIIGETPGNRTFS